MRGWDLVPKTVVGRQEGPTLPIGAVKRGLRKEACVPTI